MIVHHEPARWRRPGRVELTQPPNLRRIRTYYFGLRKQGISCTIARLATIGLYATGVRKNLPR